MISKIHIQNYKALKNIELECSNLNLLTGINGIGKSSILQSLLLLRQSNSMGYLKGEGLILKGDLINIGVGKDALCQNAEKEEVSFEISFKDNPPVKHSWIFGYAHDSDVLPFAEDTVIPVTIETLSLFNSQFQYLSAERWVKNLYDRSDFYVVQKKSLGKHGEYTPHYLEHFGKSEVLKGLLYPGTENNFLQFQVSQWMNEISPGTIVNAEKIKGVDSIKLTYEFTADRVSTDPLPPTNVGFGITYVLPIIVALLSAKPGDIVLIENPESHLHPQGQSGIAKLISLAAQEGIQLFVETHSDHIINGVLVAINKKHKQQVLGIDAKNVNIYFIEREKSMHVAKVSNVNVMEDGRIKNAPPGFFDQFSKDTKTIMGF